MHANTCWSTRGRGQRTASHVGLSPLTYLETWFLVCNCTARVIELQALGMDVLQSHLRNAGVAWAFTLPSYLWLRIQTQFLMLAWKFLTQPLVFLWLWWAPDENR